MPQCSSRQCSVGVLSGCLLATVLAIPGCSATESCSSRKAPTRVVAPAAHCQDRGAGLNPSMGSPRPARGRKSERPLCALRDARGSTQATSAIRSCRGSATRASLTWRHPSRKECRGRESEPTGCEATVPARTCTECGIRHPRSAGSRSAGSVSPTARLAPPARKNRSAGRRR